MVIPSEVEKSKISPRAPLGRDDTTLTAVLDIDSTDLGTFDRFDAAFLELIAGLV